MKKLILLLVICVFAGDLYKTRTLPEKVEGVNLAVFEIDGCEYIGTTTAAAAAWFLTHKGNCKYCEKRRKEQSSPYTSPTSPIQPYKSRYLNH